MTNESFTWLKTLISRRIVISFELSEEIRFCGVVSTSHIHSAEEVVCKIRNLILCVCKQR